MCLTVESNQQAAYIIAAVYLVKYLVLFILDKFQILLFNFRYTIYYLLWQLPYLSLASLEVSFRLTLIRLLAWISPGHVTKVVILNFQLSGLQFSFCWFPWSAFHSSTSSLMALKRLALTQPKFIIYLKNFVYKPPEHPRESGPLDQVLHVCQCALPGYHPHFEGHQLEPWCHHHCACSR